MSEHHREQNQSLTPQLCQRRRVMAGAALAALLGSQGASRPAVAQAQERLRIAGTGMALAAMQKIGNAFAASGPGVHVDVLPSLGTGGGLSAVAAGAIDLALAARPLNDAERAKGLNSLAYARTPVAFVTRFATPTDRIAMAELAPIFSGGMTIWPDGEPIRLVRREPSDADWLMLRSMSPDMAQAVEVALQRPGLMTVATDQENADALERIRGSFGAMSLGQLLAEARQLKPLALDGVKPDVDELAAGRYKLSRTLYVVWNRQPGPKIEGFLGFLRTEQATSLLTSLGHIPLSGTGA